MNRTKLIKILHSLNKKEFDQLELFLSSPLFLQKNQDVLNLYVSIKKHWADLQKADISKGFFFKLVYPTLVYDDLKMRHLLNKSVKSVDNYLIYLYNEQHELEREIQVTKTYNQRNNYLEFVKNTKRLLKNIEKRPTKDTQYYYHKYILESNYICNKHTKRNEEIAYFDKALRSFHNYIALEHINLQIDINNVKRIFDVKIDNYEMLYAEQLAKKNISLKLLNLTNQLLISGDQEVLFQLRILFEDNLNQLGEIDKRNIFSAILNVAIQKSSENPSLYYQFLLEVYELGINHHLIINKGEILGDKYLNIVKIGIMAKNLEWTKNFIKKYEGKIRKEERAYIKDVSLAYLHFAEGSYEKVTTLISKIKFPEIKDSINLRTLLVRSSFKQYQKGMFKYKSLIAQLDAFTIYLKRDKTLIAQRKEKNQNFIKYLRKVIYLTERKKWNKRRATDLLTEIKQRKDIALSTWLTGVIIKEIPTKKQLVGK